MSRITGLLIVSLALFGCGRDPLPSTTDSASTGPRDLAPAPPDFATGCGDGVCDPGETCSNCVVDCGLCAGCGDKVCASTESCSTCAEDCGECPRCGDGFCTGDENCETCAPDCGACEACGDHRCTAPQEDCFTCPDDCGKCMGCGDGVCQKTESCASCPMDCGVCAVCGNMRCEDPYETCVNCPADCGNCAPEACGQMLTCALGCIDLTTKPISVSPSCVSTCVARGCPSSQYFFDQVFNCLIGAVIQCGGIGCAMSACDAQVQVCLGARCK